MTNGVLLESYCPKSSAPRHTYERTESPESPVLQAPGSFRGPGVAHGSARGGFLGGVLGAGREGRGDEVEVV